MKSKATTEQKIVALFRAGTTQTEIANLLGVASCTVHQTLRKYYDRDELHALVLANRVRSQPARPSTWVSGKRNTARSQEFLARIKAGERAIDIARAEGISRERVRQILRQTLSKEELSRLLRGSRPVRLKLLEPIGTCVCCEATFYPRQGYARLTCSVECADDYRLVRRYLKPGLAESHRVSASKWVVAHPDKVKPFQLRHAQRVLSGEAPSLRLAGPLAGSQTYEALQRVLAKRETNGKRSA